MRIHEFKSLVDRTVDPFLHPSVLREAEEADRHRAFMATRFASGLVALSLIPLCFLISGPMAFVAIALAILGLEALVALYVSRTGRIVTGHMLSAMVLAALASFVAANTGGLTSFAVLWFAVVPMEAAIGGDRRTILPAAGLAAAAFLAIAGAGSAGLLPQPLPVPGGTAALNTAAGLMALAYAATLALRIDAQARRDAGRARSGEERYRLLADAMTDMVTCHGTDGDVTFVSPAAQRLADLAPRSLLGDGLFRRVHVADRPAYLSALSTAIHDGAAAVEFRLRAGDLDEGERWLWVEAMIRRMSEGTGPGAVVAVTRDIGRHKAQEAELMRSRKEAETSSFAKTRFLANMSHELRTPLNAIIGFSDILAQEIFGKFEFERHREYSRLIKESGEHLLQVVNDILDMSKIEAGSFDVTPEPFDIGELVERCRQLMMTQANEAGVTLTCEIEPNLPELVADRRACRQIMLNLMSNAVKFSNSGGVVVCAVRREGRQIALEVRDTGIGISAADLPLLGMPFVQADSGYDRRAEGTGLGLSVVKGLAALHGGSLSIQSKLGEGTTVCVHLPQSGAGSEMQPHPLPRRQDADARPLARRA